MDTNQLTYIATACCYPKGQDHRLRNLTFVFQFWVKFFFFAYISKSSFEILDIQLALHRWIQIN